MKKGEFSPIIYNDEEIIGFVHRQFDDKIAATVVGFADRTTTGIFR